MDSSTAKLEHMDPEILSSLRQFTLPQILYKQAEAFGSEKIAIREKAYGVWQTISWDTYFHYTKNTALGLMALGIERGEMVGLILHSGPEWLFSQLGAQTAGAVALPLYATASTETLVDELNQAQAAYVFVQDQFGVDRLLSHMDALSHLRQIVYVDPTGLRLHVDDPRLIAFSQLLELGEDLDDEQPDQFIKALWDGNPLDLAAMLRTSGTTGAPKYVMLSHENFTNAACRWIETEPVGPEDDWVSISPLAWFNEQVWAMGIALCGGLTVNFPERPETLLRDFIDIGPTLVTGQTAFWEDLAAKIIATMADSAHLNRTIFHMALETTDPSATTGAVEEESGFQGKLKNRLLKKFVVRPLLGQIGCSHARAAYVGGHAISPETMNLFRRLGLNLKQFYGLTETCGAVQLHRNGDVKPETVGRPLPDTEIRLDENREILISSQSNFMGYYEDPALSAKVLTDGWLHTGDAGYLDQDGHLIVIGRKEEMIETDGEPVSSDFIEARIRWSPYIQQAVVSKIDEKRLSALININFEHLLPWARTRALQCHDRAGLVHRPEIEGLLRDEIKVLNARLPRPLAITRFVLMEEPLAFHTGETTQTGKIRKDIIFERYRQIFDAMASESPLFSETSPESLPEDEKGAAETDIRVVTV